MQKKWKLIKERGKKTEYAIHLPTGLEFICYPVDNIVIRQTLPEDAEDLVRYYTPFKGRNVRKLEKSIILELETPDNVYLNFVVETKKGMPIAYVFNLIDIDNYTEANLLCHFSTLHTKLKYKDAVISGLKSFFSTYHLYDNVRLAYEADKMQIPIFETIFA